MRLQDEVSPETSLGTVEDLPIPDWYRGRESCPFVVMKGDGKVTDRRREMFQRLGWGRMWAFGNTANIYPGEPWGFDNGAFNAWRKGREEFPEDEFLKRLEGGLRAAEEADTLPLVAAVPDKVTTTRGMESLEFSVEWILSGKLPEEWPWYLVLQGGMTVEGVEEVLHLFDGIFIGGGHEFKFGTRKWCRVADRHGIPVHYGGCGTEPKLFHAKELGVDSIDSASMFFTIRQLRRFMTTYFELCRRYMEESSG